MTKGQIIDQLNIMGYKTLIGDHEIIVKYDNQHNHTFFNWADVESYYNLSNQPNINDNVLYVANTIFNSVLTKLFDKGDERNITDEKIENIANKSVKYARILIDKCN